MVGRSDFVYLLRLDSVEYQLAYMPIPDRYCGLAVTHCTIERDFVSDMVGQISIIWIGVDIPEVLIGSRLGSFSLSETVGDTVMVFGYLEDGYHIAILDHTCRMRFDNQVESYYSRPIESTVLWATLNERKLRYTNILASSKNTGLLVRTPMSGDLHFYEHGQTLVMSQWDDEMHARNETIQVRLGETKWAEAFKPVFEADSYYVLFAAPDNQGVITLENGKLDIARARGGSVYGVSGRVIGRLVDYIRKN
jgi:hypothetical protein